MISYSAHSKGCVLGLCAAAMAFVLSCTSFQPPDGQPPDIAPHAVPTADISDIALGHKFLRGEGVEQDFVQAAQCFAKAGQSGNPEGHYQMGVMHLNGWGVEKDIKKAASAFAQAAKGGHADAHYQLAVLYFSADAFKEAFRAALPAAQKNHAKAHFILGMMAMEAGDQDMAIQWLARAAALGYAPATGFLGTLGAGPQSQPDTSAPLPDEMLVNPYH